MTTEYSEPWGTFHSENFVSIETALQWVIPELLRTVKPGGVYLGVAPDQNFTNIVALKPAIAFIVDLGGIHWLIGGGESGIGAERVDRSGPANFAIAVKRRAFRSSGSSGAVARRRPAAAISTGASGASIQPNSRLPSVASR